MNYPIELTFKLLALASQIYIRDANGNLMGYVKQKMFKLKEDINIFADENQMFFSSIGSSWDKDSTGCTGAYVLSSRRLTRY